MASLGTLTLSLVAQVGGFTGPLTQATSTASREMASLQKSVKGVSKTITTAAGTAAAAGVAIVALTKNAADYAKELRNQATVSNTTTAELQRYAYAASSVGVEQDKLADIFKDFNDRIGDFRATGAGPMVDFFEQIAPLVGVTADQFQNLSGPQALQLYYNSLEKANLSQADMTFYLEAMSSDVTSLIPLLRNGGKGLSDMAAEADALGIVLSDLDLAKLQAFGAEFNKIKLIIATASRLIGAELSPYLTVIGQQFVEVAQEGAGFGAAVVESVEGALVALGYLGDGIRGVELVMKGTKAVAYSVGQAYTTVFASVAKAAATLADTVAGALNAVIRGINLLPGGDDIPLIASFQESGYVKLAEAAAKTMGEKGRAARKDFVDTFNKPLPSTVIEGWLSDIKQRASEIEITPTVSTPTVPPALTPPGGSSSTSTKTATAEAKAAAKAADEQRDAYQQLLDTLYPLEASQREFREEMALLDLANAAGAVDDLADAQRRLREASAAAVMSGMEESPEFGGVDAMFGGALGELDKIDQAREKLEEWYAEQLEMLEEFRQARADLNEEWDAKERDIEADYADEKQRLDDAKASVALSAAESTAGSLADIAKTSAGEQSAVYKAMFVAQKAFAIAQSIMAIQQGIAMAAANPFPYNLAAMASVAAATAGIVSSIASVAAPDGMAHDGIDSVPQDGTWMLQKGERVTTSSTSAKLDRTLDDVQKSNSQSGGGDGGVTINLYEDASKAGQSEVNTDGDESSVDLWVANIMADGKAHKALSSKYGLKTKGT